MESSCPQCSSKAFKRNGYTRHGKQNHRCLDCGRQFSLEPTEQFARDEMHELAVALTLGIDSMQPLYES